MPKIPWGIPSFINIVTIHSILWRFSISLRFFQALKKYQNWVRKVIYARISIQVNMYPIFSRNNSASFFVTLDFTLDFA